MNQPDPLEFLGDWTTNQIHMEGPMALATYVAEDGLVGHQWEEWPLGLRGFDFQSKGVPGSLFSSTISV